MELSFIQIQCTAVENTSKTQCNYMMFGLTKDGKVFWKRDNDEHWTPESMKVKSSNSYYSEDPYHEN